MHPISGIQNKLKAFYYFMKENPSMRGKIIFVQYAVPLRIAQELLKG